MKLSRTSIVAVAVAAAFFAGSVVTFATAHGGAEAAKKKRKKKVKRGPAGPPGAQGLQGPRGEQGDPATATPIDYVAAPGTGPDAIFAGSGLTLSAACAAGPDITLSSSGPGTLYVKWTTFATASDGVNTSGGESDSFTKGSATIPDILASDDTVADGQMIYDSNGRAEPGGPIVSITFHEEETATSCVFAGTAMSGG